jgi:hypothetical protein
MKKTGFIFLTCFLAVACTESDKSISNTDSIPVDSASVKVDTSAHTDTTSQSIISQEVSAISTIGNLPADWVMLTNNGGQLVIQNYCDAENPSVSITQDSGEYKISRGMGQMGELYKVISFQRVSPGNFLIRMEGVYGEGIKFAKVSYSKRGKGLAEWAWVSTADEVSPNPEMYTIECRPVSGARCRRLRRVPVIRITCLTVTGN